MDDQHAYLRTESKGELTRTSSNSSISSQSSSKEERRKSGLLGLFKDKDKDKEKEKEKEKEREKEKEKEREKEKEKEKEKKEKKEKEKEKEKEREREKEREKEKEKEKERERERERVEKEEKKKAKELAEKQKDEEKAKLIREKEKMKEEYSQMKEKIKQKEKELKKKKKDKENEKHPDNNDNTNTNSSFTPDDESERDLSTYSNSSITTTTSNTPIPIVTIHDEKDIDKDKDKEKEKDKDKEKKSKRQSISEFSSMVIKKLQHSNSFDDGKSSTGSHSLFPLGQHRGLQKRDKSPVTVRKASTENDITYSDDESSTNPPTAIENSLTSTSITSNNLSAPITPSPPYSSPLTGHSDDILTDMSSFSTTSAHYHPNAAQPNQGHQRSLSNSSTSSIISDETIAKAMIFKKYLEDFYSTIEDCQKNGQPYNPLIEKRKQQKLRSMLTLQSSVNKKRFVEDHKRSYSTTGVPQEAKSRDHISGGSPSGESPTNNNGSMLKSSSDAIMQSNTNQESSSFMSMSSPERHQHHNLFSHLHHSQQDRDRDREKKNRRGLLKRTFNPNRLSLTLSSAQRGGVSASSTSGGEHKPLSDKFLPSFDNKLKRILPNMKNLPTITMPNFQLLPKRKKEGNATEFKKNVDSLLEELESDSSGANFESPFTYKPHPSVAQTYRDQLKLRRKVISIDQLKNMASNLEAKMLIQSTRITDQREKFISLESNIESTSRCLNISTNISKSLIMDQDDQFEIQLRIEKSKPAIENSLNSVHDLYERAKTLEDTVQILRRSKKTNPLVNFIVKIFITGWLSAIFSFIYFKLFGSQQNELNNTIDNKSILSNGIIITPGLTGAGGAGITNSQQTKKSKEGNGDHLSIGHNYSSPSSPFTSGISSNSLIIGNSEQINQSNEDKMKVALSNLEAMSRTISMLRENDEDSSQSHDEYESSSNESDSDCDSYKST